MIKDGPGRIIEAAHEGRLRVVCEAASPPHAIETAWRDLERRSHCSFFQSWGWIGCWLNLLPQGLNPRALIVSAGSNVVGLGIVVANQELRHGFLRSRVLHLSETGDLRFDRIGIEYNGLLAEWPDADSVLSTCLAWLKETDPSWDEVNVGGLDPAGARAWADCARALGLRVVIRDKRRYDYVDLESLRVGGTDYLARLSRNTRHQIRRALRLYAARGPLAIEVARDIGQALDFLAQLKRLHQAYWTGRGLPGAFANPFFEQFHRDLIEMRFEAGEIQLIRVSVGEKAIGSLYNFAKDGRVYAYQSGFEYDQDPKLKPGLVSHYLAIEHNIRAGAKIYDFMAGDGRHKRSLGTDFGHLTWLVLQRKRAIFRLENAFRSLSRRAWPA